LANEKQTSGESSRRTFLKVGGGLIVGVAIASAVEIPLLGGSKATSTTTQVSTAPPTTVTSTVTSTDTTVVTGSPSTSTGSSSTTSTSSTSSVNPQNVFLLLSTTEAAEVTAMMNTIIPTDSNGPGATSAGAAYFLDKQLASAYGANGDMYQQAPFVQPGQTGSITVDGITYSGGSAITIPTAGTQWQYGMLLKDFWRYGLDAFETYCNSAYGGNFETLASAKQVAALTDLANNKPTTFANIVPSDFFQELFLMTWCGFLMDPLYGGNQNMVGWELTGFNGTNQGNFYGEGYTTKQLMVMTTPIRLKPASLAQFQAAASGSS
jgi:gluconate 2-dehydrogenase gamma chain